MSNFKLKDPNLFLELSYSIQMIERTAPEILTKIKSHLNKCIELIKNNIKETDNEINKLRNKQRGFNQESLNLKNEKKTNSESSQNQKPSLVDLKKSETNNSQKLQELKNTLSELEHLKIRFDGKVSQITKAIADARNGQQILKQFHEIALKYLAFPKHIENHLQRDTFQISNKNNFNVINDIKQIGDTFHYSNNDGGLSQFKVNEIERNIMNSSEKGRKISIDNISQSDFSVLEQNGYTIQKIDANQFTAYKNIEK